jgi:hypothetical protein
MRRECGNHNFGNIRMFSCLATTARWGRRAPPETCAGRAVLRRRRCGRDCLKTRAVIFVNDPIFDMMHFDEVPRRIRWCKNEF